MQWEQMDTDTIPMSWYDVNYLWNKKKCSITLDRHCLVVPHFKTTFADSCKNVACQTLQFQASINIIDNHYRDKESSKIKMKEVRFPFFVTCHHLCNSEKI